MLGEGVGCEMTAAKVKSLSSLVRSATETTAKASLAATDATLEQFISSLDDSAPSTSDATQTTLKRSTKFPKGSSRSKSSALKALNGLASGSSKLDTSSVGDDSRKELSREISSILYGGTSLSAAKSPDSLVTGGKDLEGILQIPWCSSFSHIDLSLRRREISRDRKHKWIFKSAQHERFDRLVRMCAYKLGADATLQVFGRLGRETGIKEYNSLISLCIEKARETEDEEVSMEQIAKAYQLFRSMKEQGFQLEEETYGPFLMFLIDMQMVQEFLFFCGVIRDENPNTIPRLAYYEMLLWIKVNNEKKIKQLCDYIAASDNADESEFKENYLLALCESDRLEEILQLLDITDITKFSSVDHLTNIFRSLGRLSLESFAEKFIWELKSCDLGEENISDFIYTYAVGMPNLVVEDTISKLKDLHGKLEVTPSTTTYEKLIRYCCDSLKVHVALDIVEEMFEAGLTLSIQTLNFVLYVCDGNFDYNLVRRIYSLIHCNDLKPNSETFRIMINMSVRMKDFEGAYNMIEDLQKLKLMPTASMYNAVLAGYYREKNMHGVSKVLKEMENAEVKPDAQTFSYLIGNCDREEDIVKYYEELKLSGVQITKHVFMALINAYAACGQFEKAKQVVSDKCVPVKVLSEIKGSLVSALASHGQISDALNVYEELKQGGCAVEPKTITCLINHLESEGELTRLLELLQDIHHLDYWIDGCCRVIAYCVRYKHLSSTVDLLKQLKDKSSHNDGGIEVFLDEVFWKIAETEPADAQFGLKLLEVIKQELDVPLSRKSLDFLLSTCVTANDLQASLIVWKEYSAAGLPYNILSLLRMYQALLASGNNRKSAKMILAKIPKDDPHVRCVIKACEKAYM